MDAILSRSRLTLFSMGGGDRAKIPDGIRATGVRDYLERQGHSREAQHRPGELGASPVPKGRMKVKAVQITGLVDPAALILLDKRVE